MTEQAYFGTCPADDPGGFRLSMLLSHPSERARFRPTVSIGCPIAELTGEGCPDGGTHMLRAVTVAELTNPPRDDLELVTRSSVGRAVAALTTWAQSPSDGLWHALQATVPYRCPECAMVSHHPEDSRHGYCANCHQFQGWNARCGHRLPSAVPVQDRPGQPACMGCLGELGGGLLDTGGLLL